MGTEGPGNAAQGGGPASGLNFEELPGGVAVLTFDRPSRRNAVDWPLYEAFVEAVEGVGRRTDIRVLLLRGAGGAFCAGGDISFMKQMYSGEIDKADVQALQVRFFSAQMALPQPTIAVVDGPAIGLGCTFALSCDLVYAGERARFADPHVQMGLVPGDGGTLLWPLLIGPARAKEFLFTGDVVGAADAFAMGLVNRVYPSGEVFDRAVAYANRLAAGPAATIQAIKALTNQTTRALGEQFIRAGLAMESVSQESEYHKSAVERFLAGDPVRF
jgi:enoyl-CoA hydratase